MPEEIGGCFARHHPTPCGLLEKLSQQCFAPLLCKEFFQTGQLGTIAEFSGSHLYIVMISMQGTGQVVKQWVNSLEEPWLVQ